MRAATAGLAYFALVFMAGAILGTVRVVVVAPHIGAFAAVLIELPFMLIAAWFSCRWLVRRFSVPGSLQSRLLMGGFSFALLIAAELALTIFVLKGSLFSHFAAYGRPAGMLGLAGQLAFAFFPLAAPRE